MEQILSRLEANARAYEDQDATALQEEARQQYEENVLLDAAWPRHARLQDHPQRFVGNLPVRIPAHADAA